MSRLHLIIERQWLHAVALVVLIAGLTLTGRFGGIRSGMWGGMSTLQWFWLAVTVAVVHQVYVWFCWRTQLYKSWITRCLGRLGFPVYAVGFSILGIARIIVVCILALSNRDTLPVDLTTLRILAVIVLMPAIYLFYSVQRYFGFKRALGIDHFDAGYRSLPFVRQGIFRFTRNGMYTFGFLILWVPALWYASLAAVSVALFNHLYIWVHYFATERPDMKHIYGPDRLISDDIVA